MKPSVVGRRSSIEIIFDILSTCEKERVNKTAIMYRGNLSYAQLVKYVSFLIEEELLHMDEDGQYLTTPKGEQLMKDVGGAISALRESALLRF